MRRFLFILLLLPVVVFSQSQYIINDENLWSTVEIFCLPEGTLLQSHYLKIEGDTVINDTSYHWVHRSFDEFMVDWEPFALLRENEEGQVFLRPPDYVEGLIYDFETELGDTINVENVFISSFRPFVVTQVDSVLLETGYKKRIILYNAEYDQEEIWIEEMGSFLGLINAGGFTGNTCGGYDGLCFTENGTLVYQNPLYDVCYLDTLLTGINENQQTPITVFPNPFVSELIIDIPVADTEGLCKIFNSSGQLVWEQLLTFGSHRINLSYLSQGIYFLNLGSFSARIVKK